MLTLVSTEFQKIKRYHILLIGVIGMFCSPLLQLFSQLVVIEEVKNPNFDLAALLEDTVWGDAQIFMPVLFTLIGGYLINREYTDDTLKNILTVPVSFRRLLAGKLLAIGLLAVLLGVCSFVAAVAVGVCAGLPGAGLPALLKSLVQMAALSVCIYIVVLPVILLCSRRPGSFMGGSVAAFLTGYSVLFFKSGLLRDIYPFSAALTLVGFDSASYMGAERGGSLLLAAASLGVMLLASAVLLFLSKAPGDAKPSKGKRGRGRAAQPARRAGRR